MRKWLVCLMLIFTTSCAGPEGNECGWARLIVVNGEDHISRRTAEQIVAHNRKVEAFCR